MKTFTLLSNGRTLVKRKGDGVTMYYDSRHKISRVLMIDGTHHERLCELQPDGSYRQQMYVVETADGDRIVFES